MSKSKEDLISQITEMALGLGRAPTRKEFESVCSRHYIEKAFGNYTILVTASGLTPYIEELATKKIDNKIFERDIDLHIQQYKPRQNIAIEPYPTAAIISDIHYPFVNKKVECRFLEYVGDVKPEFIIINGDAWDMYSHTKFPRSHNVFTPKEEMSLAKKMNAEFWFNCKKLSPDSKRVQMLGNHDVRPMKRIMEEYPEAEDWVKEKLKELFTFEDVKTIHDIREEFFLNNQTIVFHGFRSKLGDHRDYTLYNSFNGHSHVGGVVFRQIRGQVLWECNSGFAGDPEAKGLTYTPQKISNWTPGFANLSKLGPMFIHL